MNPGDVVSTGLVVLAIGGGAALLIVLFRLLLRIAPMSAPLRMRLRTVRPLVEAVLVLIAVAWIANRFFADRPALAPFVTLGILGVAVAAAWLPLRDLVSGVLLRSESEFERDQWIHVEGIEGRVRGVGLRALEVERDDGLRVRVPWHRLAMVPYARATSGEAARAHTFTVEVQRSRRPAEHLSTLHAAALNCFYSSPRVEPQVRLLEERERSILCEVTVYAADPAFFPEIEAAVKKKAGR